MATTNGGSEKSDALLVQRAGDSAHTSEVTTPTTSKAASPPPAEHMSFGGGLLPDDAKAEKRGGLWQLPLCANRYFSCEIGFLYVNVGSDALGYSFALGLDLDPRSLVRECSNPLFYRALVAEFAGTLLLLYFALTCAVYRGRWITGASTRSSALEMSTEEPGVIVASPDGGAASDADAALSAAAAAVVGPVVEAGALGSAHLIVSLVFGLTVFLLVYMLAPVSGGHFNPAITWGLAVTRKVTVVRAIGYTGAQMGGAVCGTLLSRALDPKAFDAAGGGVNGRQPGGDFGAHQMLISEIVGTFLLVSVVYAAVDPQRAGAVIHISALGPLAIGFAIAVAHLATLPITGCSVNPARSFGAAAVAGEWADQWVFWVGPLVGAGLAALVYEAFFKGRRGFEEKWA